jgi:dienelactone hydrolase
MERAFPFPPRATLVLLAAMMLTRPLPAHSSPPTPSPKPEAAVTCEALSFESGGRRIQVDRYSQAAATPAKPRRAILVLHGAGGMLFDGSEMKRMARHLASIGDDAYVIHYFNRTGAIATRDAVMQKHFETWLGTVRDAVGWVQKQQGSAAPVGIYGYSLGGFTAVAAASNDRRIGAIVEHAGGVWNSRYERIGRMPPVLMVHGLADGRVPFDKYARPLESLLRRRTATLETNFYPGEGHRFTAEASVKVCQRAGEFFARRLPVPKKARPMRQARQRGGFVPVSVSIFP